MKKLLIKNIKKLIQCEQEPVEQPKRGAQLSVLDTIDNAFLITEDGVIKAFGPMDRLDKYMERVSDNTKPRGLETLDAAGKIVMPAFCDSHTHLVYAGSREMEYSDKLRGLSYQEIAARGGGILNSANLLHNTSEEELYRQSVHRA